VICSSAFLLQLSYFTTLLEKHPVSLNTLSRTDHTSCGPLNFDEISVFMITLHSQQAGTSQSVVLPLGGDVRHLRRSDLHSKSCGEDRGVPLPQRVDLHAHVCNGPEKLDATRRGRIENQERGPGCQRNAGVSVRSSKRE
jgi:hypothetical protein